MNSSTKFEMSDVAKLLNVDKEVLKLWSHTFSIYLSSQAVPEKGRKREFLLNDIRVLAYIYSLWEEEPDIENINYGLNSNDHFENPLIEDLITSLTPFFQDFPEEIDETWKGVIFGGEFILDNLYSTANSFKIAGDRLVDFAFDENEERELFQPAIYNYRHSIELYLKAIIGEEKTHNLQKLYSKFKFFLKEHYNQEPPNWFENIIDSFAYSDPEGTAFRYGITVPKEELYADMKHIKRMMDWASIAFCKIKDEEEKKKNLEY